MNDGLSKRRLGVLAAAILAFTGCASSPPSADPLPPVPQGDPVSVYMQNLTGDPVEFTMLPRVDPPVIFEVLPGKVGAACTRLPTDWQMAQTEAGKPPGEARVLAVVARDRPGNGERSIWVSMAGGAFTNGEGVPDWWVHGAQSCAPQR